MAISWWAHFILKRPKFHILFSWKYSEKLSNIIWTLLYSLPIISWKNLSSNSLPLVVVIKWYYEKISDIKYVNVVFGIPHLHFQIWCVCKNVIKRYHEKIWDMKCVNIVFGVPHLHLKIWCACKKCSIWLGASKSVQYKRVLRPKI